MSNEFRISLGSHGGISVWYNFCYALVNKVHFRLGSR